MAEWTSCMQCGLKHVIRPDGRCPRCGQPVTAGGLAAAPAYVAPGAQGGLKIPNYLVQAILVTLCCCTPGGVVAIVYAAQVNSKLQAGDVAGAQAASASAKTWCWVSFWVGLVVGLGMFAVELTGARR